MESERFGHMEQGAVRMFIASAQVAAQPGKGQETAAAIVALRDAVTAATGQPWAAWYSLAGDAYGTFAVTCRHESLADMTEALISLEADVVFQEIAAQYVDLIAEPAPTSLDEVVHAAGDASSGKPFVVLTEAQLSSGNVRPGLAHAVQIADLAHEVTGIPTLVTNSAAGPLFQLRWITAVDSMAEIDEANAKLAADPRYLALLDEVGDDVVSGSVHRTMLMRLP